MEDSLCPREHPGLKNSSQFSWCVKYNRNQSSMFSFLLFREMLRVEFLNHAHDPLIHNSSLTWIFTLPAWPPTGKNILVLWWYNICTVQRVISALLWGRPDVPLHQAIHPPKIPEWHQGRHCKRRRRPQGIWPWKCIHRIHGHFRREFLCCHRLCYWEIEAVIFFSAVIFLIIKKIEEEILYFNFISYHHARYMVLKGKTGISDVRYRLHGRGKDHISSIDDTSIDHIKLYWCVPTDPEVNLVVYLWFCWKRRPEQLWLI